MNVLGDGTSWPPCRSTPPCTDVAWATRHAHTHGIAAFGGWAIRLEGKVILVTGFGSGLGRELALAIAREGARVAGFSRRTENGEETARLIHAAGGEALFVPVDVRENEQVERGMAEVVARFGGLDGVVNCAGARVIGTAEETSPGQWNLAIGTNLTGTFLVSRAALPELRKRGRGAIVNITTTSALKAAPGRVAHGVSKSAVHMLTASMALDHAGEGITVNCVCPGPTALPSTSSDARDLAATAKRVPDQRVGTPADVAEFIVHLLSDAGRHVTGTVLPIDGGLHLTGGL